MNATLAAIRTLALLEARVRLRRLSTLVTLLAVVALSWMMISDPADGQTLISVRGARVLYTSSAMALGSAALATLLLTLAGFYLLRGRVAEDLRSGTGSVIGASANGGALFVVARWCGGVLYLAALVGAFMATVLLCHAVRGDGPIEPLVYLQTYALVLGPMILFTASCATLSDAWAPLMGKKGDLLYFFVWVGQMALLPAVTEGHAPVVIPFDFTGTSAVITALGAHVDINDSLMLGIADFDRSKAALTLPTWVWTAPIAGARCLTALPALVPLLLALPLFHRFSPDRVRPGKARARRTPLAVIDGWLRPLARLVDPLFGLAARVPGIGGQALADVALTLAASPSAIALLLAVQVPALVLGVEALAPFTLVCVAYWGVLVSDLSTRDGDAALAGMGAAVPGGAARRYWRQFLAGLVLGLMFTGVAILHLAVADPVRAVALSCGVFALAGLASFSGRTSGTSRTFLALFLFALYVSVNVSRGAWADIVGFHGNATLASSLAWTGLGVFAVLGGHLWNRRAQPA
ncbi:hypothetical protein SAMN05428966_11490 [Massilia sp. PDC64]|nr:hypothetical protein [Massilia sp. PDC64]SDF31211.1 hypothetical protein SAMN05428966_11490 [Massilia sp. PDC64]